MKSLRILSACLVTLFAGWSAGATADENTARQAFQAKTKMTADSVTRTPFANIYEAIVLTPQGYQTFYIDEKTSFILKGELFDTRGEPRNLTQDSMGKIAAAALSKSAESAVKRVKGNGKRVIYTFEDPNCGYCKELQRELMKVNDVTIYTFLWPILSQDSVDKSKAIWCAKDRGKAWDDAMLKGVIPTGKRDCDTPLDRNGQLAQRFGLRGTPAVYLANGQQIGGFVAADKIEAALGGK